VCVGSNYHAHVEEMGRSVPEYPVLFTKFATSLVGPYDDIVAPPESEQIDFEGELAVVIGTRCRRVAPGRELEHVAGYAVANDVSMRDFQYRTHQWLQGKAWDASTPLGPMLVTPDEVDVASLDLHVTVNGETMQSSNTSLLIFDLPRIIRDVSVFATLEPGDVILTGTPGGVGFKREPQVFLRDGDRVAVEIAGVGRIENDVRREAV
jgi:acylpyruvate hydrolase